MQSKMITAAALGLAGALTTSLSLAAAPDWSKVAGRETAVFYPGVSPIEWIMKGTEHGGARGIKMGETCSECHSDEIADMGQTIVTGEKIEPAPIKGKAGSIPVTVRAAHDGSNLYLQFTWKQPAGGAARMDTDNQVKLSVLMAGDKLDRANLSGCWEGCHGDLRTMPNAKSDDTTKCVANANLAGGVYYDLMQWTSKGATATLPTSTSWTAVRR